MWDDDDIKKHKTKNKSLNITLIVVVVIKMLDEKKQYKSNLKWKIYVKKN